MFTSLQLAMKSVVLNKARTILTILAISIGIAAVIMVFAAGHGLNTLVVKQMEVFGTDFIEIEVKVPNVGKTSSENAQGLAQGITITTFKNDDVDAVRKHDNISYAYGALMANEAVRYQEKLKKLFLMGVGHEAPEVDGTEVLMGRFFSKEENNGLARVAVLGHESWQKLFDGEDPVGESITVKGKKYKVIGVMEERGSAFFMNLDDMVYVPVKTLQKRVLGVDYITFGVAKMVNPDLSARTQDDLIQIMREQHDITDPKKDDFSVNTMDEAMEIMGSVIGSITGLLVALVFISLIVGGVGIMNIMYVSVAERTFEIGLRKSVGAKSGDILWQFLFEALIITLGGGIVGVILGAILSFAVTVIAIHYGLAWEFYISISSILLSVGFSMFIGFLFGIYPAKKAAGLDPITALRKE